ncbi:TRAP transporter substrate-binding protein [Amorphus orientalis]|uniref:TRAP-type C4-dicarboxylate transport system substrate-binding protein n=1 Tax=Amorphus orientalis TaxID=649198 RepID=A0AAE3VRH2_9HYPH|nr:TRAP transporter substrate-binding protein [Amorphus orientalis]MDQ0317409.1 TRAP-type C4-dicarboxylate transport system substrate-binding protein [Amorphus orientalis]
MMFRNSIGPALLGALALIAVPATWTAPAAAQSTLKLASATINDVQHEWQKVFAEKLKEKVGDQVTTEIYPASQLGPIPRMSEGVLLGTIEAFTTPTSFMTNVDPRFQAFDVPGLFKTPEDVDAAIHDPDYRDHMETMFLDKGLRVIGAIYNSPTVVFTMEPAETLSDFEGLKIRTFASPMQVKPMELIGAIPLPLALSEVVPQLQSGGLDGLLVGMPILTAFKFYDVGKNVTDLRFAEIVSVTVMNEAWFQSQPEEVQQAIIEAGREAEEEVFPWGVENVQRTYDIWEQNGGEIYHLPSEEQTKLLSEFNQLAEQLVSENEAVEAEYDRLKALVAEKSGK